MSNGESTMKTRETGTAPDCRHQGQGRKAGQVHRWGRMIRLIEPMYNDGIAQEKIANRLCLNVGTVHKMLRIRKQMLNCETFEEWETEYGRRILAIERARDMWSAMFDDDYDDTDSPEDFDEEDGTDIKWRGDLPQNTPEDLLERRYNMLYATTCRTPNPNMEMVATIDLKAINE